MKGFQVVSNMKGNPSGFDFFISCHLEEVTDMFGRFVQQFAMQEDVTERLKAENQILWVQRMNNIRNRATEIVNQTIIYL